MGTSLDRRAFIAAATVSSIAVTSPVLAVASNAGSADRRAWDSAMAAHEAAKAEDEAFNPVYDRVSKVWEAGKPSMDSIHWSEFRFADRDLVARTLNLEKTWNDFLAGEGKWWSGGSPAASQRMKDRQRAALDSVQAFRDAEARHDRESGMDAAEDRWEALGDAAWNTRLTLLNMRAPDLSALRWKLAQVRNDDGSLVSWRADIVRQTFDDIDRLLPEGA